MKGIAQVFNTWRTHYDITMKQAGKKIPVQKYFDLYSRYISTTRKPLLAKSDDKDSMYVEASYIAAEVVWINEGRPYYNFHMNLVEPALRMKLNKIPMKLLDVPRDFNVVNVRFQEGFEIVGMMAVRDSKGLVLITRLSTDNDLLHIHLPPIDTTIEDYLNQHEVVALKESFNEQQTRGIIRKAVQLYATTKFLADVPNDELIEYDVINKLKGEYRTATMERRKEIERISRKKGHLGWNVGVSERIVNDCGRLSDPGVPKSGTRELSNSHIRAGHLHAVRFGPGKQNVKIMLYRPIRVRPDLAFKEGD